MMPVACVPDSASSAVSNNASRPRGCPRRHTSHIPTSLRRAVLSLATLLLAIPLHAGVFDVSFMRADRGEVILDHAEPPPNAPSATQTQSEMLQRIYGTRAILTSRDLSQLRAGVSQDPRVPLPAAARRVALIRLGAASRTALVEIFQLQDGTTFAREFNPPQSPDTGTTTPSQPANVPLAVKLDRGSWDKVSRTLHPYRAGFTPQTLSPAPWTDTELGTLWPAPWIIDGDEIDRRFIGKQADRSPASRDLSQERFAIHVSPGVTARRPASLLIWLSPMANAQIPEPLIAAAAQLDLVIVAPTDIGPNRDLTNRIQLSLDAAYAAQERWLIDPDRIYIGGFSAGAGLANLVWMAFPDVFRGTLLVSSASFYQEVQAGPASYWPRQFNEPVPANMKRLANRRSAVVVGENDPARPHTVAVAKRMSLESIRAESYVVPGLAHEIPDQAYLLRGLRWIDADAAAEWSERCERGDSLLASVPQGASSSESPSAARSNAARRRALIAVTREAPWTPAAWAAVEMLTQGD